jgi:hypothetical protein
MVSLENKKGRIEDPAFSFQANAIDQAAAAFFGAKRP